MKKFKPRVECVLGDLEEWWFRQRAWLVQRPGGGTESRTPEEQTAASVAGVSYQKVAGGREKALRWVSWAFANGKEGSMAWETDLGWRGSSTC